jgi:uncharacterized protein YecE (DUF72 family)
MAAAIRIGISGWRYTPWRGQFYPADLPQRRELEYASRVLSTIEINGSFYSLQRPECYASWYADTPPGFVFAVKGGRFITHMRKLRNVEEPLANFLASGLFNLKEKLGPILWQFPPIFKYDRARIEPFLEMLPHDTRAACALARKRSAWMKGRTRLAIDENRELRHAIEIRNESFLDPSFIELLRAHNIALVIAETAGRWPMVHDITADFVYLRLHGDKELYRSGYSDKALERWARRIRAWSAGSEPGDVRKVIETDTVRTTPAGASRPAGDDRRSGQKQSTRAGRPGPPRSPAKERDVYCFFDNTDVKLRAPVDAQKLMRLLGLTPGPGLELERRKHSTRTGQRRPLRPGAPQTARAAAKPGPRVSARLRGVSARPGPRERIAAR